MSQCSCYIVMGRALGIPEDGTTQVSVLWHCMWRGDLRGNNASCLALGQLSVTFPTTHKQIGPFWCSFLGSWVCVCSGTLWVSPANSPVRLGVSPATAAPIAFYHQRLWRLYFPVLEPWVAGSASLPSCSSQLSTHKCGTTWSPSHHLARSSLPDAALPNQILQPPPHHKSSLPSCLSLPLLPGWMNVSSLTLWLSDFHKVWFSGSYGCFLFLNLLLSFFWLCEEVKCIYLRLYLGWKSRIRLLKDEFPMPYT